MIVAAIVLFVVAVAVVGTTVAATAGILKRNTIAGIRVPALMASDEAWEEGHHAALLPVTVGGVLAAIGGIVLILHPAGVVVVLIATIILFVALLAWGVLQATRRGLEVIGRVG